MRGRVTVVALRKEFPYVFSEDKYPGTPMVKINPIENRSFKINGTTVVPIEVKHYMMTVFGFRIKDL